MVEKKSRSAKVVGVAKKAVEKVKAAVVKPAVVKAPVKAEAKPVAKKSVPHHDFLRRIEYRAYEIYINRGADHGNDQDDWYQAERLVRQELGL
ncbi:MAG: DUF2934 domain-containing protein [Candidatus Omnitrophota bacterium]